jgi:RNA recognition motif-containing protein
VDDETASVTSRSSFSLPSCWGDFEDHDVDVTSMPPGTWQGPPQRPSQRNQTKKSRNGTTRLVCDAPPTAELKVCSDPKTTVVVRKLPTTWTRADVLDLLGARGFQGLFDFVYLPFNFKRACVFGYAVVNFPEPADAERAIAALSGIVVDKSRILAEWSESVQGSGALVEKYRNSALLHKDVEESHRPLLLRHGVPVAFPNPSCDRQLPVPDWLPTRQSSPLQSLRSTLIVRGLSRSTTVAEFMELLDESGFVAQYNFVYVPRNFSKGSTFGYAVLNFTSETLATAALTKISNGLLSAKGTTLSAEWSQACTGLEDLVNKYRNNRVMKQGVPESYRPQVLFNGKCVPYPGL